MRQPCEIRTPRETPIRTITNLAYSLKVLACKISHASRAKNMISHFFDGQKPIQYREPFDGGRKIPGHNALVVVGTISIRQPFDVGNPQTPTPRAMKSFVHTTDVLVNKPTPPTAHQETRFESTRIRQKGRRWQSTGR